MGNSEQRLPRPVVERLVKRAGGNVLAVTTGPGWDNLLDLVDEAIAERYPDYELRAAYENGGALQYATNVDDDPDVARVTFTAASVSTGTCERCGGPGRLRTHGWTKTFCTECYKDYAWT